MVNDNADKHGLTTALGGISTKLHRKVPDRDFDDGIGCNRS
jgi:hypothetical protein